MMHKLKRCMVMVFCLGGLIACSGYQYGYSFDSAENVRVYTQGGYRYIKSRALPDHATGMFPNRGNPNAIAPQSLQYRIPLQPRFTGEPQDARIFGVALNGIPFELGTAECFAIRAGDRQIRRQRFRQQQENVDRSRRSVSTSCDWREEAIVAGQGRPGLDRNFAHVQPNGLYHYHGVPIGYVQKLSADANGIFHVGFAADRHKIVYISDNRFTPGYRLRFGQRPKGKDIPSGVYSGEHTADFVYDAAYGDLDRCNGAHMNGEYLYVLTHDFPFCAALLDG